MNNPELSAAISRIQELQSTGVYAFQNNNFEDDLEIVLRAAKEVTQPPTPSAGSEEIEKACKYLEHAATLSWSNPQDVEAVMKVIVHARGSISLRKQVEALDTKVLHTEHFLSLVEKERDTLKSNLDEANTQLALVDDALSSRHGLNDIPDRLHKLVIVINAYQATAELIKERDEARRGRSVLVSALCKYGDHLS